MSLLKKYFYDSLKLNPSYKYYIGLTDRLSYYENEYSIEYMKNYDNHINKYLKLYNNEKNKNTEDNILLKHELDEYFNIKILLKEKILLRNILNIILN